jgi:DNA-binding NarL/FixJ family response regulator
MTGPFVGHPTILIAEDEDHLREALHEMLEGQGFDVVAAARTGLEAVTLAAAFEPDVVLMDYRMPEMDGVAATEAIKEARPSTIVVMFTAHDETSLSMEASRAGVSAFLVKGCPPSLILRVLTSELERIRVSPFDLRDEVAG